MPNWKELRRFCERDEWELYKTTDHFYYRKYMEDGTIKRTRASNGSKEIPSHLWHRILKQQLQVSQEYFNQMI